MGDRLIVEATPIAGVHIVRSVPHRDARGAFERVYCEVELAALLDGRHIVQINRSTTSRVGAARGLHFQQSPHAETKLIRCLKGKVYDVAVDLRASSPTLLSWHGVELSPDNGRMAVIPPGCAHGFQALLADSELLYLHTAAYSPHSEAGFALDDVHFGIAWPLPLDRELFSERDRKLPCVPAGFRGVPV